MSTQESLIVPLGDAQLLALAIPAPEFLIASFGTALHPHLEVAPAPIWCL